jgi:error-prone DNA polymerase
MTERGIAPEIQRKVVDSIGSFALYGFPESHAVSFALLAYASCWLKVHHPAEFYTGLINQQPMGFYSVNTLIQDAKRRGIRLKPVSCVESRIETIVEDDWTLRLGLNRMKGLSDSMLKRLIRERETRPFLSLEDFLTRVHPNDKERRTLAQAGALNDLPKVAHRRDALWQSELPLNGDLLDANRDDAQSALPPMTMAQRLTADFATQGASSGPHPMRLWREQGHASVTRAIDLHLMAHGRHVTVGGMAICRQRPGTAKGHCFISLEDETGIANLFVPKPTFDRLRLVIVTEPFLLAHGRVQRTEGDQPTIYVEDIQSLPGFEAQHASKSHDFH